jgi:hypothetical protein
MVQHRHSINQLGDLSLEGRWVSGDESCGPDLDEERIDVVVAEELEGDGGGGWFCLVKKGLNPSKDVWELG